MAQAPKIKKKKVTQFNTGRTGANVFKDKAAQSIDTSRKTTPTPTSTPTPDKTRRTRFDSKSGFRSEQVGGETFAFKKGEFEDQSNAKRQAFDAARAKFDRRTSIERKFNLRKEEEGILAELEANTPEALEAQRVADAEDAQRQGLVSQVGELTPEQFEDIKAAGIIDQGMDFEAFKAILGKRLATNVAGGAVAGGGAGLTAGLIGAPITAGLSVPAATAIGTGIGAATGTVKAVTSSLFDAFETVDIDTVKVANQDFAVAKTNMKQAIQAANQGNIADKEIALIEFNRAKSKLYQIERTFATAGDDPNEYLTGAKEDQEKILSHIEFVLPVLELRMREAIARAEPSSVGEVFPEEFSE